jgi:hypothetical protein
VADMLEVHQVEPMGDALLPLIVTTGYKNALGYFRGEYFLAIPDVRPHFTWSRVSTDARELPPRGNAAITLDEAFMSRLALRRAQLALQGYVRAARAKDTDRRDLYPAHPEIVAAQPELLVNYWLDGPAEHLSMIGHNTEVDELRDYVRWLLRLPPFEEKTPSP